MAQPGRPNKPAAVHLLHGNPSKLPLRDLKAQLVVDATLPECPDHLDAEAKCEWSRIGAHLVRYGLVSQLDRAALAVYCQSYSRWVKAERMIAQLGDEGLVEPTGANGYKQMNAWLQVSNAAVKAMQAFLGDFGLTPASRARFTDMQPPQMDLFEAHANSHTTDGATEKKPAAAYFTQ